MASVESLYNRRLVHVSGSLVPIAYLLEVLPWEYVKYLVTVGAGAAVVLEFVRLWIGLDWAIYDRLTRDYEADNPAGYALALVAAAIVVWAFEPAIAVTAMLVLTIADPIAGVLSDVEDVDRMKPPWVMAVTFLVSLAIAAALLPVRAAVPVAVAVVLADAVKPRIYGYVIDDNFSIPVSAGVVAWVALAYLPPLT